jgi:hypothetical protein
MKRDKDRFQRQWKMSNRRGETLADDLQIFLGELCKGAGFCSALADDILRGRKTLTAEAFASAVLAAEGWPNPEQEYEWRPQFVKLFVARYGPEISATTFARTEIGPTRAFRP